MRCRALVLAVILLGAVPALAADDPDEEALQAARIDVDGPSLVEFFKSRTVSDADRTRILALVKQLGADEFTQRERASASLVALGPVAEPLLRRAAEDPDPEVKRRAEECLTRIAKGSSPALLCSAARVAGRKKPAGGVEALLNYAPFSPDELVTEAVQGALAAMAVRDGKPDPILVAALTDRSAPRRAAAGVALARTEAVRDEVRKLLSDGEVAVRHAVATALVKARDRDAMPVLLDLLPTLSLTQAALLDDMLRIVAGESAPSLALGSTTTERTRHRDAWRAWWKAKGAQADLARLDRPDAALLGHTLVVQRDPTGTNGRVVLYGRDGEPRWQIENIRSPLDAQILPGNRVLVSEYTGKRIAEYDLTGRVLWEQTMTGGFLVGAQRLTNGNTFIAMRNQLLEIDKDGKQVSSVTRTTNDIYAARRLRTGETVLVTSGGLCVRLDAAGKELTTFPCGRLLLYGGFDALANGNLLIPNYSDNRVSEYDAKGNVVWTAAADRPASAMKLPSGNVLIASVLGKKVYEIDRTGKIVWEQAIDGRPYRAYRR